MKCGSCRETRHVVLQSEPEHERRVGGSRLHSRCTVDRANTCRVRGGCARTASSYLARFRSVAHSFLDIGSFRVAGMDVGDVLEAPSGCARALYKHKTRLQGGKLWWSTSGCPQEPTGVLEGVWRGSGGAMRGGWAGFCRGGRTGRRS
jgi:hypothetical protein